jgi:hypothetical protein
LFPTSQPWPPAPPASTALLDAGIPVHIVADAAILLRNYVKRKRSKQADKSHASALASFSGGFLAS